MSKQFKKVVKEWPELFTIKQNIDMQDVLCFNNFNDNKKYYIIKKLGQYYIYETYDFSKSGIKFCWYNTLYGAVNRAMKLIN